MSKICLKQTKYQVYRSWFFQIDFSESTDQQGVCVLHSVLHGGHVNIGLQTEVVRWIIIIIIGHGGNLYGLIKIVAGSMEQLCYLDMILNEFQLKSGRKMIELHFSSISWATLGCSIPFSTQMYLNYQKFILNQNQLDNFVHLSQSSSTDCRDFERGVQNQKDFCLRNNMLIEKYCSGEVSKSDKMC